MIGSGLKKLAAEYGMKVDRGVAYGPLQGFAATMNEGSGWKRIIFSTTFADPTQKTVFMDALSAVDVKKDYRVINLATGADFVEVVFHDTVGTMGKIREFLVWFLPLLRENGASAWDVCPSCGCVITGGKWMLYNGGIARYYHPACAEKAMREVADQNEQRKQEDEGSYVKGTIGALVGALIGGAVWAAVLLAGYMASLIGLLIGWLSDKGYRLLKGKNGKGKIAILIIAVILGVVIGTLGADAVQLANMINAGEINATVADIPLLLVALFTGDDGYRSALLGNIGTGLLFAALGVYWFVMRAGKEVADNKMVELK